MTQLLVSCPQHGIFPMEGLVGLGPNSSMSVTNVWVDCPWCGQTVTIIDGDYRTDSFGNVSAKLRPTPAQLERLLTAARWAQDQVAQDPASAPVVVEKISKTIKKESPDLFKWLEAFSSKKATGAANFITMFMALLTLFQAAPAGDIPEETMRQVVTEVLQQQNAEQQSTQTPSTPTPPAQPIPPEGTGPAQQPPE